MSARGWQTGVSMNKYYVKMMVEFEGEIEAESQDDAEQKSWTEWGAESDAAISYSGVYSVDVEDLGEICSECEEGADNCECEDEDEEDDSDVYTVKEGE